MKRTSKRTEKTTARICRANQRQSHALQLRIGGASLEAIARQLGYKDRTGAFKAIEAALSKSIDAPAAALRELEVARLDAMLERLWMVARRPVTNEKTGEESTAFIDEDSLAAMDRIFRVMERRAKLLGLDAPAKAELSGPDGAPMVPAKPIIIIEANGFESPGAPTAFQRVQV